MILAELFIMHEVKPPGFTSNADPNTGFYGKWGAGCIPFAQSTKRFLINHRSDNPPPWDVEQPGTWGVFGGKGNEGEKPEERAVRELSEESGHIFDKRNLVPLFAFKSGSFRFHNFLLVIDKEFTPRLQWESQGYRWCEYGDWPSPLHFGLEKLLADPSSIEIMKKFAGIHEII